LRLKLDPNREVEFQITYGGRAFNGTWRAINGEVHVSSAYGSRTRSFGKSSVAARALAEIMLRELVQGWQPPS